MLNRIKNRLRTFITHRLVLGGITGFSALVLTTAVSLGATVSYNLRATTGTATMPDGEVVKIWGFADCGTDATCAANPSATLPAPPLNAAEGDTLNVRIKNDLPEPVSLLIPGQAITPVPTTPVSSTSGRSFTTEISPNTSAVISYSGLRAGTFLYESGTNQAKQVQMGLYGALIVRPTGYTAANQIAYAGSPVYNREQVLILSEIDPDWHRAVAAGTPYNAFYFTPKYWLINGKAYPDTQEIISVEGENILLRYLNAGSQDHVIVTQGLAQTEIAKDAFVTKYPHQTFAVVMNPGQTQDLLFTSPSLGNNPTKPLVLPLYDRRLDITNVDQFPGGMITMIRVINSDLYPRLTILSTPPGLVTEGHTYDYKIFAVDGGNMGSTFLYSVTNAPTPSLATKADSNGQVTWYATSFDTSASVKALRNVSITVTEAQDASQTQTQTFPLYVNSNPVVQPPVFLGGATTFTVTAGTTGTLQIVAADPDNGTVVNGFMLNKDTLTYSLGSPVPGMTIDNSGLITWVTNSSMTGLYSVQVVVSDGKGGFGSTTFQASVASPATAAAPPTCEKTYAEALAHFGVTTCSPVTIVPTDSTTGLPIPSTYAFKYIVNLDNSTTTDPVTKTCGDIVEQLIPFRYKPAGTCTSTHQYESNSQVVATGTVTSTTSQNATVKLPPGRYFISVVAGTCPAPADLNPLGLAVDCTNPAVFDHEVRNGGIYKVDGAHVTVPAGATIAQNLTVSLAPNPLPLSQVTVQVFQDNRPVNGEIDAVTETVPMRNGIVDHFKVELYDLIGPVMTDYFNNPICTEYNLDPVTGNPDPKSIKKMGGQCLTDDTGFIAIKNLTPDRYNVFARPPIGSDWVQTNTIEGTNGLDAWALEGGNGLLPEMIGTGNYMIFDGYSRPCTFGDGTGICPTSSAPVPLGTQLGSLSGHVVRLQARRYPFLQSDGLGDSVAHPWIAINHVSGNNEQVALVQGDADGNFKIQNIPPGNYTAVIFDDPKDFIMTTYNFTIPSATVDPNTGSQWDITLYDPRFGNSGAPIPDWYGELRGTIFYDANENGIQDPGEPGLPQEYTEVRFRDGSLTYSTTSDMNGSYRYPEYFPWMHFNVAGIGYSRLGSTGVHVVAGAGQRLINGTPIEERTDLGPVLVIGTLNWAGDRSIIDWGKKAYPLTQQPIVAGGPSVTPLNGGISGVVWYATTRNEKEIRYAVTAAWEPGVPDLYLDLYERVIDPATGKTAFDTVTGAAIKGKKLGRVITDHYNRPSQIPTNCPVWDSTGNPAVNANCDEMIATWFQVRPAAYDGAYQFFYDCSPQDNPGQPVDPATGLVDPAVGKCSPLAPGRYLVELEVPQGYLPVTENDRNVINQGDTFVTTPLKELPPCVGPVYQVVDNNIIPGYTNPDLGKMKNLCSTKEVQLDAFSNGAADFRVFTEVPIPSRLVGFVNDNLNLQKVVANGWYGDKPGVPYVPVAIRDFLGREIARVYTDPNGMFDVLVPSTNRTQVPKPTGLAPNMVVAYANDPGTPGHPDPAFNPNYDTLIMQFELLPGKMTIPDMALTPVNGGLAIQNVTCLDPATPQINSVVTPYGAVGSSVTINGLNFGVTQGNGKVTLDGIALTATQWSANSITATISGVTNGKHQLLVTADNGKISPAGITFRVGVPGTDFNLIPVTAENAANNAIQTAIDAALESTPTMETVILISPGVYPENLILWKAVSLQGFGTVNAAGQNQATVINGSYLSTTTSIAQQNTWGAELTKITPFITTLAGQPVSQLYSPILILAPQTATASTQVRSASVFAMVDGMTVQGARVGGGIFVNSFADFTQISNNLVQNNISEYAGGISLGFPPTFGNNQINAVRVHHNIVTHNGTGAAAVTATGGIGIFDGVNSYQIDHNIICANGTTVAVGGIYQYGQTGGNPASKIDHNDVIFNWSFLYGGGITIEGVPGATASVPSVGTGPVTIDSNRIYGNFANSDGAGINITSAGTWPVNIVNNMIVNNVSGTLGGGISVHDASNLVVINNTIANNNSTSTALGPDPGPHAAGLAVFPNTVPFQASLPSGSPAFSDISLFNNVFWGNHGYQWDTINKTLVDKGAYDLELYLSGGTLNHSGFNLFEAQPAAVVNGPLSPNLAGTDPLFALTSPNQLSGQIVSAAGEVAINPLASPVTITFTPMATLGDYHIRSNSPAIDYGAFTFANSTVSAPAVDFDGQTRPMNLCIDSGADETPGNGAPNLCGPVTASLTASPVQAYVNQTVTFDASGSSPLGTIVSYTWNFGDGTPVLVTNVPVTNHIYTIAGSFTASVTVADTQGLHSSTIVKVTIYPAPAIQFLSTPITVAVAGYPYAYQATASDAATTPIPYAGSVITYSLNGTLGLTINSVTGQITANPIPGSVANGSYTVTVTATSSLGTSANQVYRIAVKNNVILNSAFDAGVSPYGWQGNYGTGTNGFALNNNYGDVLGAQGLSAALSGSNPRYLFDARSTTVSFIGNENSYHARFLFNPNSVSLTGSHALIAGYATTSTTLVTAPIFSIDVQYQGAVSTTSGYNVTTYQIRGVIQPNGAGAPATTGWIPVSNDFHTLEVNFEASTSMVTPNGSLSLTLDEGSPVVLGNILNDQLRINQVRFGVINNASLTGSSGSEYLDQFASTRKTAIGRSLLQERYDGTVINAARWSTSGTAAFSQYDRLDWSTTSTTQVTAQLDGKFTAQGAATDLRVNYNVTGTPRPVGTGYNEVGLMVSNALTDGTADTRNNLILTRRINGTSLATANQLVLIATVNGAKTTYTVNLGPTAVALNSGMLRFLGTVNPGVLTQVIAQYWTGSSWVTVGPGFGTNLGLLANAKPLVVSTVGDGQSIPSTAPMTLDSLRVTAGTLTPALP